MVELFPTCTTQALVVALLSGYFVCNAFAFVNKWTMPATSATVSLGLKHNNRCQMPPNKYTSFSPLFGAENEVAASKTSVDVSDLGLTLGDLDVIISDGDASVFSSGTSQEGHYTWSEDMTNIEVQLQHPGMRGQPSQAVHVYFTETTVTITIFGRAIWSGILQDRAAPEQCTFVSQDDPAGSMIPQITMNIRKESTGARWNEFISSIGIDSVLTCAL